MHRELESITLKSKMLASPAVFRFSLRVARAVRGGCGLRHLNSECPFRLDTYQSFDNCFSRQARVCVRHCEHLPCRSVKLMIGWRAETRQVCLASSQEGTGAAERQECLQQVSQLNDTSLQFRPIPYLLITNGGGVPDAERRKILSDELGQTVRLRRRA